MEKKKYATMSAQRSKMTAAADAVLCDVYKVPRWDMTVLEKNALARAEKAYPFSVLKSSDKWGKYSVEYLVAVSYLIEVFDLDENSETVKNFWFHCGSELGYHDLQRCS